MCVLKYILLSCWHERAVCMSGEGPGVSGVSHEGLQDRVVG